MLVCWFINWWCFPISQHPLLQVCNHFCAAASLPLMQQAVQCPPLLHLAWNKPSLWASRAGSWTCIFGTHLKEQILSTSLRGGRMYNEPRWSSRWWYISHLPFFLCILFLNFPDFSKGYLFFPHWFFDSSFSCKEINPYFPTIYVALIFNVMFAIEFCMWCPLGSLTSKPFFPSLALHRAHACKAVMCLAWRTFQPFLSGTSDPDFYWEMRLCYCWVYL